MPQTHKQKTHFVALDFLRFLMAACVVLFHYEIFIAPDLAPRQRLFGTFDASVDFFFMLSGFVISHTYGATTWTNASYLDFMKRRIARIYPLHIATLVAFIAAAALAPLLNVSIANLGKYDFSEIPAQVFLVHAWGYSDQLSFNHISWSISAEFCLYLIFPVLFAIVSRYSIWKSLLVLTCVMALLSFATTTYLHPHWLHRTYDLGTVRAIPSFALGIIVWHVWSRLAHTVFMPWFWPLALIALAFVLMYCQANRELIIAVFAISILATGLAESCHTCGNSIRKTMKYLGDISYGLYMLHILVGIAMFKLIMPRIDWLSDKPELTATLAFIMSLVAARISYRTFEMPMRKLITNLDVGRTRRQPALP